MRHVAASTRRFGRWEVCVGLSIVALASQNAPAQPPNNECATAIALVDGLNAGFTTVGATPSGLPNPTCAGTTAFNSDVWFTYTATCAGQVTFSMCGPAVVYDSILQIYTGSCGSLTAAGCDDDGCPTPPAFADVSVATSPGVTAGTTLIVRVGGFSAPDTGAFQITVSCAVPTADFGDAPTAAGIAQHTNATAAERLGTTVTAEAGTATPSWYGDGGDDSILSVADLNPGSTTAQIVVLASNPGGTLTDFCRIWVDRNNALGWANIPDALPTQSATVGPAGTTFTFGPFTYSASAPASPFVRARLSSNTTGVSSPVTTGAFGEVEDYVLPGTGGSVPTPTAGGGGGDVGDAPLPYPPVSSTFVNSERLGLIVSSDETCPLGFEASAGDADWHLDFFDDGIVRIDGLTPGGSCTIVVQGSDPLGTFTDTFSGWIDFNSNGTWDEVTETFAPVSASVGPSGTNVTLGPLPVPAAAAAPFRTRIKLSFGTTGAGSAGAGFTFGEIEDYLLPRQLGPGCNTASGLPAALWSEHPPELDRDFLLRQAGLIPGVPVGLIVSATSLSPIDLVLLGLPIPPGACFLTTTPDILLPVVGVADPSGNASLVIPVPPTASLVGASLFLQNFQFTGLSLAMTNSLAVVLQPAAGVPAKNWSVGPKNEYAYPPELKPNKRIDVTNNGPGDVEVQTGAGLTWTTPGTTITSGNSANIPHPGGNNKVAVRICRQANQAASGTYTIP